MGTVLDIARRVRKGVRLLDKKLGPTWRQVMRKHAAQYNFENGECCVLGTLEHHSGRLRTLKLRRYARLDGRSKPSGYAYAADRLQIYGPEYGFDISQDPLISVNEEYQTLSDMWCAEFEAPE